jgi:putative nucleotidyltransferase with HDIG domain
MNAGLDAARAALAGGRAWLVGGAVRDRLLARPTADLDVVVEGDPAAAARAVARAAGSAACFALSEEFGAWRVSARDGSWQVDVEPLRGGDLSDDLAMRDFTVNAIAEPLSGGEPVDPLGGIGDLRGRRLRMTGSRTFTDDPLRVLRLVRIAVELELRPDEATRASARAHAAGLASVSGERVFMELRRIVASPAARDGLQMLAELGSAAVVLPELEALRGVEQSRFHHLDVYDHTMDVLQRTIELGSADAGGEPLLARALAPRRAELQALLAEPLADQLTRAEALRWGALLHDVAKPLTRQVQQPSGRVTFIGHDVRGAELARSVLARLRASERLRAHVAALVRHHLRLGFLVHEPQPLAARTRYAYLRACAPVEVDVTLLSIADRLGTRGDRAQESINAHLALAEDMLDAALRWRADGPPPALLRGDELAEALGIAAGPRVGELLEGLAQAQYGGEVSTREQALAYARELLGTL